MSRRTLKLGAILIGVGGPGQHSTWLSPEIPGNASVDIRWYIARAQEAEAAKFDLVFIVDSQFITADSPNHYLSRLEPLTLLSAVAVHTSHIGLVGTITTSYNEPFNVARRLASLDHISGGRAGWNVVTSGDAGTAGNYSRDEHYDYATRYGRALEHVRVAQGLWDSYEADAFPRDKERGVFLDRTRQHQLNHKGEYFSVVGPLNLERSPQGQPVIFQAGDSEEGRDLGASIADAIFTHAQTIEQGQAFRTELRDRAAAKGRDPDHLLIMPGIFPIVADTDEQARAKEAGDPRQQELRARPGRARPAVRLARLLAVRPGRALPRRRRRRGAQLPDPGREHQEAGAGQPPDAAPGGRAPAACAPLAVRRLAADGGQRDPALVRGRRLRRHQHRRHGAERVRPLHRAGAADPAGARRGAQRVRVGHAARQPRPAGPGEPLHGGPPGGQQAGARLKNPARDPTVTFRQ